MIDWWAVTANSLWILGLSILLAAFSYHDWLARETGRRRRDLFNERSFQLFSTSGMLLTCLGWGLGQAARWWEKALWLMLAATFAWKLRSDRATSSSPAPPLRRRPRRGPPIASPRA